MFEFLIEGSGHIAGGGAPGRTSTLRCPARGRSSELAACPVVAVDALDAAVALLHGDKKESIGATQPRDMESLFCGQPGREDKETFGTQAANIWYWDGGDPGDQIDAAAPAWMKFQGARSGVGVDAVAGSESYVHTGAP